MNEIILWLNTPSGEEWSRSRHCEQLGGNVTRFSHGVFASVKDDHECGHQNCYGPSDDRFTWLDKMIREEIISYGMNGIPDAALMLRTSGSVPMLP